MQTSLEVDEADDIVFLEGPEGGRISFWRSGHVDRRSHIVDTEEGSSVRRPSWPNCRYYVQHTSIVRK